MLTHCHYGLTKSNIAITENSVKFTVNFNKKEMVDFENSNLAKLETCMSMKKPIGSRTGIFIRFSGGWDSKALFTVKPGGILKKFVCMSLESFSRYSQLTDLTALPLNKEATANF